MTAAIFDGLTNQQRYVLNNPTKRKDSQSAWREKNYAKASYLRQRGQCKDRGLEFNFTFEEWMEFWGDDLPRRGRRSDQLHMCRYGDEGNYEPENCYKATCRENQAGPRPRPDRKG